MKKPATKKTVKKTESIEQLMARVTKYLEANKKAQNTKEKEFQNLFKALETVREQMDDLLNDLDSIACDNGYTFPN